MPSVPIDPSITGAPAPSQANLMMALADMHKFGALAQAAPSSQKGPAELPLGTKAGKTKSRNRKLHLVR